jgi:hypothetical protein
MGESGWPALLDGVGRFRSWPSRPQRRVFPATGADIPPHDCNETLLQYLAFSGAALRRRFQPAAPRAAAPPQRVTLSATPRATLQWTNVLSHVGLDPRVWPTVQAGCG